MMLLLRKSHPVTQAMSGAAAPADLNEPGLRRNHGEPSPEQAEADRYNKPRVQWRGLTIAIENPAGSVRRGRNRHGVSWEIRMRFDYGEIVGSMGVDGDPVDIYLGPNLDAPMVYVVHQRRVNDWENYDEDKCMVGFDCEEDARQAFLSNYTDPRFLGPITAMPVDEFVAKVRATKEKPAMIKSILFFKGFVGPYLRGGKMVNVRGYHGRDAKPEPRQSAQLSLFDKPSEPQHTEPTRELIAEHERLVDVLNSPSHADDKVEAERQAAELAEMKQEVGEHDHLLADMPGAKWRRGKGLIAGHYGVEVDGKLMGNYHAKPEDAVAQAKQWMANQAAAAKDKADRVEAIGKLRERLMSGVYPSDADLKLLGLREESSGLQWFIPAAAEVFGISSRAVRPHIKDMIRVGHTDMGVKKEFVKPKAALLTIAASLGGNNGIAAKNAKESPAERVARYRGAAQRMRDLGHHESAKDYDRAADEEQRRADYKAAVTSTKPGPTDDNPRRKFYVTIARQGRGVAKLAGPFDTHDEAKAHVDRARYEAYKLDPESHFDAFGTSGIEADEHKPGVLNERLGIGAKPAATKPQPDESEFAEGWSGMTEKRRLDAIQNAAPSMSQASGKPSAAAKRLAAGDWSALPDAIKEKTRLDVRIFLRERERQAERVQARADAAKAAMPVTEAPKRPDPIGHKDQHEIGGLSFTARRIEKPRPHWRAVIDETGQVIESWSAQTRAELWDKLKRDFQAIGADRWRDSLVGKPAVKPAKVTPQVPSAGQLDGMIKIAVDSVEKLRRPDVDRVISEAPAHFRLALSTHIKEKRPDLSDEVDDVLADYAQPLKKSIVFVRAPGSAS